MQPQIITLPEHLDDRGRLAVAEAQKAIPFEIKRAFWIYDVPPRAERGNHAHIACHQVLVAVAGSVTVIVSGHDFWLHVPRFGLWVPPGNTIVMRDFSFDARLVVLCSQPYDAGDYVDE